MSYYQSQRPAGWTDVSTQFAGPTPSAVPSGAPSWTAQYSAQNPMYAQFFQAGDFSRSGMLDEAGLQAALAAAGETQVDPETIEMMILMFDTDYNNRIDFNALMNYINTAKNNYAATAAANGGVVSNREAEMIMSNTHGTFMNDIGGNSTMERGILPTINPTQQGFFSVGNIIKIAIIVGVLRTLYEHNKLPFFSNQSGGQAISQGQMGQQQYGAGYGQAGGYGQQQYNPYGGQYGMQQPTKPQKSGGLFSRIFGSFGRH